MGNGDDLDLWRVHNWRRRFFFACHSATIFLYAFDLIELATTCGAIRLRWKRKDSIYRSGRSRDWIKMKNSDAPGVKREAEEGWGR